MKRSPLYPRPVVAIGPVSAVGQAGGVLLIETIRTSGLGVGLSAALSRWRHPGAVHDPGKVLLDLAVSLALGGDCLADVAVLRAEVDVPRAAAQQETTKEDGNGASRHTPRPESAPKTAHPPPRPPSRPNIDIISGGERLTTSPGFSCHVTATVRLWRTSSPSR